MVPAPSLVAFAFAALLLIVLPGPSVLFVIGRALATGRIGALLSVVGNAAGMLVQVIAIALGLGVILEQSIVLLTIVKFAGAAFLVYLGIQAIRHRHRHRRAGDTASAAPTSRLRSLVEGAAVGVTNPKSVVFFIAVLPQFVDPGVGGVPTQMIELGAIFSLLALVFDSAWALAAGDARDWFARSPVCTRPCAKCRRFFVESQVSADRAAIHEKSPAFGTQRRRDSAVEDLGLHGVVALGLRVSVQPAR